MLRGIKRQRVEVDTTMKDVSINDDDIYLDPTLLSVCKILIVGAGALGCEILKNLVISGFKNIDIIDMDLIELHNLHRQFLFRQYHIGQSKAIIAAQMIKQLFQGHEDNVASITPHYCKIQEKDVDFYRQFHMIICGLDSIEARRWINALVVRLVDPANLTNTVIPLIDGGTEGFHGQCRLVIPKITACIECNIDLFDVENGTPEGARRYPLCTIAQSPRLPEHCVEWAMLLEFPKEHDDAFDAGNLDHLKWVYKKANERADSFSIQSISWTLMLGIVQNIVPAMISTNALIAALCVTVALQLLESGGLNRTQANSDYYMIHGALPGLYCYPLQAERRLDCPICGETLYIEEGVPSSMIFSEWIKSFCERNSWTLQAPSIRSGDKTLYMSSPLCLKEATERFLHMPIGQLLINEAGCDSAMLIITDPSLPPGGIRVNITLNKIM